MLADRIRDFSVAAAAALLVALLASGWGLAADYAATDAEAFASVRFIRQESGGAALRSLHHWGSSALVVAGFAYLLTTFLAGRHRDDPKAWWAATGLYLLSLGFCFTGFLLPMDQNAYWGTVVRLGIVETVPWVGEPLARALRGGSSINASTLPRFYIIHVSILPLVALIPLWPLGVRLRRRLVDRRGAAVSLGTVVGMLALAYLAAGLLRAPLELAADPVDTGYVPRPEWYFLWLFQLGKYVESVPWVQSLLLPAGGIALLVLLPFRGGQGVLSRSALAGGWCLLWIGLTGLALWEDRELPPKLQYEVAMRQRAAEQYRELCLDCHGAEGRGDGPQARIFRFDARDFTSMEAWRESSEGKMRAAIRDGEGKDMPAFGRKLGDEEIGALVGYLRDQFAPEGAQP